jgi:hypothetical protein
MPRIRMRFVMLAATVMAAPMVYAGITYGPVTFANDTCTSQATDSDKEYAGDIDLWCTTDPSSSPSPLGAPSPNALPPVGGNPGPDPSGSPSPGPSSSPSPAASPLPSSSTSCSAPGAFPTASFAPYFVGPISRTFTSQYIADFGTYIETCYPAGSSAPSSGHPGGAQAQLHMAAAPLDDATLTYQVRFPVGTQFVKGGKLPGLCGGQCWTGSNNGPGGWSTRFMWRAGGAGEVLLSDATTTGYGTDLGRGSWTFLADGQWHTLTQTIH